MLTTDQLKTGIRTLENRIIVLENQLTRHEDFGYFPEAEKVCMRIGEVTRECRDLQRQLGY